MPSEQKRAAMTALKPPMAVPQCMANMSDDIMISSTQAWPNNCKTSIRGQRIRVMKIPSALKKPRKRAERSMVVTSVAEQELDRDVFSCWSYDGSG